MRDRILYRENQLATVASEMNRLADLLDDVADDLRRINTSEEWWSKVGVWTSDGRMDADDSLRKTTANTRNVREEVKRIIRGIERTRELFCEAEKKNIAYADSLARVDRFDRMNKKSGHQYDQGTFGRYGSDYIERYIEAYQGAARSVLKLMGGVIPLVLTNLPEKMVDDSGITEKRIREAVIAAYGYSENEVLWTPTMRDNVDQLLNNGKYEQRTDGSLKIVSDDMIVIVAPGGYLSQVYERTKKPVGNAEYTMRKYYPDGSYKSQKIDGDIVSKEWSRLHGEQSYEYSKGKVNVSADFLKFSWQGFMENGDEGNLIHNDTESQIQSGRMKKGLMSPGVKYGISGSFSVLSAKVENELRRYSGVKDYTSIQTDVLSVDGGFKTVLGLDTTGPAAYGEIGVKADVIKAELEQGADFEFAGIDVKIRPQVSFGIGAHAEAGYFNGKAGLDAGIAVGKGIGVSVEVDASDLIEECGNRISQTAIYKEISAFTERVQTVAEKSRANGIFKDMILLAM